MSGASTWRQVRGALAAAPKPVRRSSGIRTSTDRQDGRDVVWHESKRAWAALIDVADVALHVTAQKLPANARTLIHPGRPHRLSARCDHGTAMPAHTAVDRRTADLAKKFGEGFNAA